MLIGVLMMSAVAHQTLSTGLRPFEAMRRFAGAPFAWLWALGALIASIIWHFPQYSLAAAGLADLGDVVTGDDGRFRASQTTWFILVIAVSMSLLYGKSPRATRIYERTLKWLVWVIVLCFATVVIQNFSKIEWGEAFKGLVSFRIPGERQASDGSTIGGTTLVISGLAAAVGINMLFLYPYSLLARGWGRAHRRLARFDLWVGMLLPYAFATGLMILAMTVTLHASDYAVGKKLSPVLAAQALSDLGNADFGRVVLDLGFVGMGLSSITLHMICAGFVCCELFGWRYGSRAHRLASLIPIPGVLGPILWNDIAVWLAVPTNIICMSFLPAAYVGFIILQRSQGLPRTRPPRRYSWQALDRRHDRRDARDPRRLRRQGARLRGPLLR